MGGCRRAEIEGLVSSWVCASEAKTGKEGGKTNRSAGTKRAAGNGSAMVVVGCDRRVLVVTVVAVLVVAWLVVVDLQQW